MLNLPTAYWHEWVADLRSRGQRLPPALRLVVVGGDKALGALYQDWREVGGDDVRWINAYGPTEATIMSTTYEPAADREDHDLDRRDPPIGRPLPHATVHLLDGRGQPVAPGSAGEVYIGGPALARGYLNRLELTAERFVADPYGERAGDRLYRTGDLARAGADGELEFVGRLDEQVKVQGFRIEVGEMETALASHPGVAGVAVAAREDRPGNKRLMANTVPAGEGAPAPGELRRFLAERLPGYMGAVELMSVLPTEIQYFHVAHDEWAPGIAVIERPGPDAGSDWLYFRGQLPPLSVTFLDDGSQLWAECNYKVDFYDHATVEALARSIENELVAASADPRCACRRCR